MIKTEIRFVSGFEPAFPVPKPVKSAGLGHRFAVIQETYRSDCVDMYFDEALWLRLLAFATHFASGAETAIAERQDTKEVRSADFLAAWNARPPQDRNPPAITVRDSGKLVLYIEPEYWVSVGGPMPYHDSYTYSIYAKENPNAKVMQFLAEADAAGGWNMSADVLQETSLESVAGTMAVTAAPFLPRRENVSRISTSSARRQTPAPAWD